MSEPVYKADVALCLADALQRLGKNDWNGVRFSIKKAGELFEQWLKDRPEKKEDLNAAARCQEFQHRSFHEQD